ncbi:hypothetical protein BTO15_18010 [Polaribacter sejongensis]|uniref:DUF676 domain-containing protein n=1 Tax=Polaribacter sejongensis TaxID=985043 RepID=A0ABN5F9T3_9FLAO|nr:ABC-three component system protein [Polaribacter sejongensis]AUC23873.1 hypothetical protein BTO15_18010 [Polaribacter sejongensis]
MIDLIHQNVEANNVIVFVHGFVGGKTTWINENGEKPLIDSLLLEDEIYTNFDIGVFTYHTQLLELFPKIKKLKNMIWGKKTTTNSPIDDIAKILKTSITYRCEKYDNIILIGHSMGGLVSKRFILDDINEFSVSRVKLYISLATPHSGSNLANLGGKIVDNLQVNDMKPLGKNINELNDEWVKCTNLPKRFYAQGMSDKIVPKESSVALDRDKQKIFYSDDDHFSIIIPDNENDNILLALKSELIKFFKNEQISSIKNNEVFKDKGQYDDEVFVLKLIIADVHDTLISGAKHAFFSAEFTARKLVALGVDVSELSLLYEKIKQLYIIEFGELITGKHNSSNALVNAIHKQILEKDRNYLNSNFSALEGLQKYGMLHQLSIKDEDIWWAKDNDIKTFNEFKDNKSK